MNTITQFVRRNGLPCALTAVSVSLTTALWCFGWALGEWWMFWLGAAAVPVFWIAVWMASHWPRGTWPLKIVTALLAFGLMTQPVRSEQLPIAIIGVLIIAGVVGIGGCVVVKAAKNCKKVSNRIENEMTNESPWMVAGGDANSYAASFTWPEGYCDSGRLLVPQIPTRFTLDIRVGETNLATTITATTAPSTMQSWWELQIDVERIGLTLTGNAPESSFGRNGQPVTQEQVPITMVGKRVQLAGGGMQFRIERSDDLVMWETAVVFDAPKGQRIIYDDVTDSGMAFYRVRTEE